MQPLRNGGLASPSLHLSHTSTTAVEPLDAQLQRGNPSTFQILLQRDSKCIIGTSSSGDAGGVAGSDDALISASISSFSSPVELSARSGAESGTSPVLSARSSIPLLSTSQLAESLVPDHVPQQRGGRRWTPRRVSPCSRTHAGGNGGAVESAVTTVRDWVRSAGCSPSKEPRSASISRRDSLASSFASTLVPRDGRWELSRQWVTGEGDDGGEERGRCTVLGARTAATRRSTSSDKSAVNSGRDWDAVDSWSCNEAQIQRPEGLEVLCAPTSSQRTPSWRQLHSHPTTMGTTTSSNSSAPASRGNRDGAAALACSSVYTLSTHCTGRHSTGTSSLTGGSVASTTTDCGTAATQLSGWGSNRRVSDGDDESCGDQPSLSGVSSPSFVTPPPSRRGSAPIASLMQPDTLMLSSSTALTAHELAQLREWRSVAEAQRSDLLSTTTPTVLPPFPKRSTSEGHGGCGPSSWCLERLSCASFTSLPNGLWSGRSSTAQTPLDWERDGAAVGTGGAYRSSCVSPACWSTGELDVGGDDVLDGRSGGRCSRLSSPVSFSFADMNGQACGQQRMPHRSPLTSPPTSPSCAPRAHGMDQSRGSDGDDSTMEDIEMRNTKRKCVENPRESASTMPLSQSFGLSLADALAAAPTYTAMPHEAHLWQQQQRRRRAVSPSVVRPDEELLHCDSADSYASTHCRDRSTFSPPSPIRTTAPSMVPVHPPPPLDTSLTSFPLTSSVRGRPHEMSGDSPHVASVDGAAAVLETPECTTGVVVEVDDQHAAPLSSCGSGSSDEEPEVDTFSLERAQAAMEDADAEATSALRARQHRLYLLSTSQFAQDVERHGGHVDPVQLELEAEAESEKGDEQEGRAGWPSKSEGCPGTSCVGSARQRGLAETQLRWEKDDGLYSLQSGVAVNEEGEKSLSLKTACIPQLHTPHASLPSLSTESCATPSVHLATSVELCRVSGEDSFATPLRRSACIPPTASYVRWGEPGGSEDGHSPGSVATTTGSRSRRDVSPPVRERSMAPAELRKEREGYEKMEYGSRVDQS
ncbi:hypothetical protein, unknown function [Leishmania tarentolae]|uniref:Uncharacterized protein n=1 Tax=Leishmania tarentolae TaxID=5689 RepID=A0A640KE86_LEITA|nr:hypothetical protein, unknown function [Leishmania tarentolae]